MTRSRRFFASSPWIATGTPDYVNLGYTSRGLAKQALMRLSRTSLAIFRKLGLEIKKSAAGSPASLMAVSPLLTKRLENVCGTPAQTDTNQPNPFLGAFVLFLLTT